MKLWRETLPEILRTALGFTAILLLTISWIQSLLETGKINILIYEYNPIIASIEAFMLITYLILEIRHLWRWIHEL